MRCSPSWPWGSPSQSITPAGPRGRVAIGGPRPSRACMRSSRPSGRDPFHGRLETRFRPFSSFGNATSTASSSALVVVRLRRGACVRETAPLAHGRRRAGWVMNLALMLIVHDARFVRRIVRGAVVIAPLWLRRSAHPARAHSVALARRGWAWRSSSGSSRPPLGSRLLDIGRGIGLRDRVLSYQSAFQMFLDHPFLGVGSRTRGRVSRYQQAEWGSRSPAMNTTNTSATTGSSTSRRRPERSGSSRTSRPGRLRVPHLAPARTNAAVVIVAFRRDPRAFYGSGASSRRAEHSMDPWVCVGVRPRERAAIRPFS